MRPPIAKNLLCLQALFSLRAHWIGASMQIYAPFFSRETAHIAEKEKRLPSYRRLYQLCIFPASKPSALLSVPTRLRPQRKYTGSFWFENGRNQFAVQAAPLFFLPTSLLHQPRRRLFLVSFAMSTLRVTERRFDYPPKELAETDAQADTGSGKVAGGCTSSR